MAKVINVQTGEVTESATNTPAFVPTVESVTAKRWAKYPSLFDFQDAIYAKEKGDDSKLAAWVAARDKVDSDNPLPSE